MNSRGRRDTYSPAAILAQFNRLPETARFYSALSALVLALAVVSGVSAHRAVQGIPVDLNPRAPMFDRLSPWGRVVEDPEADYLRPSFEVVGVVTPIPGDAASCDYVTKAGEDLESIAVSHGIDLDILSSANNVSYARVPGRKAEIRLPLLYSRDRSWDRSLEFLYPIANQAPMRRNAQAASGPLTIIKHQVARGENLWTIARKYDVSMDTIIAMNDLTSARSLRPGQTLEIPSTEGTYVTVGRGETLGGLCKQYSVDITELVNANPGVTVENLRVGLKLFVPGTGAFQQAFLFAWPAYGRISGRFGYRTHPIYHRRMMHTGLDIAARSGTPIRATLDGRVKFVGWKGGYGRTVILEHANGYETLYGHCSKTLVKKGQSVKKGQTIASVGSTGVSNGPHLHFEVKKNGKRVNPDKLLF
jgi:murein DD-endopeptidase MepM/ murein hydrolase activator NlpD